MSTRPGQFQFQLHSQAAAVTGSIRSGDTISFDQPTTGWMHSIAEDIRITRKTP